LGSCTQAHGELEPALVAARQAAADGVALVGEAHILQHVQGAVADLAGLIDPRPEVQRERAVALGKGRDHDVLDHGQVAEDLRGLEDSGDAGLVDLVRLYAQ